MEHENVLEKNESGKDSSRLCYSIGYLENENMMASLIGITGFSYDFTSMTPNIKTHYLHRYTRNNHQNRPNHGITYDFYSSFSNRRFSVLLHILNSTVIRFTDRIQRLFVPKFYHDRKDTNFLKGLIYIGEKNEIDKKYFSEDQNGLILGRKLYEYRIHRSRNKPLNFQPKNLDWPFPEKCYASVGYTVHGFSFKFKNATNSLSAILNPQYDLINVENGLEEADNDITEEIFFPFKETLEEKIAEHKSIPTKNFVNESYFLSDKSNLIKKTFVTAINKQLSLYG